MAHMAGQSLSTQKVIILFWPILVTIIILLGIDQAYSKVKEFSWGKQDNDSSYNARPQGRSQVDSSGYQRSSSLSGTGLFNSRKHQLKSREPHTKFNAVDNLSGSAPGSLGRWIVNRFPAPETPSNRSWGDGGTNNLKQWPVLMNRSQLSALMNSPTLLNSLGKLAGNYYSDLGALEIKVFHSKHLFQLISKTPEGANKVLYECKVGLGAPSFPTPKGIYYVTHIYDDNPWWIPPENRAWAAGQSASKRVYGGTMAPLLKKKPLKKSRRSRRSQIPSEDFIAEQQCYADYGYRFHGTSSPRSIGRNQSHGCVRMLNEDAKNVADIIKAQVGEMGRGESENGEFCILNSTILLRMVQ